MPSVSRSHAQRTSPSALLTLAVAACLATLGAPAAQAGGTPDPDIASGPVSATNHNQLFGVLGPDRGAGFGDYVTDDFVGLQSLPGRFSYDFYIEVPPGQTTLRVLIFDADLGAGEFNSDTGNVEWHDQDNTTMGWDMMTEYELFDPDGVSVASIVLGSQDCDPVTPGNQSSCDNDWSDLGTFTVGSPSPGHWRFSVSSTNDTSATDITEEDDNNSYGIRADDGDFSAGGTEYNVYADTYIGIGQVNTPAAGSGRDYDLFPLVVNGCTFDSNDFDSDPSGDEGITFSTRQGGTPTFAPIFSGNGVWTIPPDEVSGFTTGAAATDYGLWSLFWETGGFNFITYWLGDNATPADDPNNNAAPNQLPDEQPEAGSFRFYLPEDGAIYFGLDGGPNDNVAGFVPSKPWVGHSWAVVSGPDPILAGATSRVRVTITVDNPTPRPIQFDAATGGTRGATANVPSESGQIVFVPGSTAIVGGTSTATSETGVGPWVLEFAPGVIAAGTSATLTYDIDVTPTGLGSLNLTGGDFISAFSSILGTTATYLDETCADPAGGASACTVTAQARASLTYGPLCNLFVDVLALGTPGLMITKNAGVVTDAGGGLFDVTYTVQVANNGTTNLLNVQVVDDLDAAFGGTATFTVTGGPTATGTLSQNAGYDGTVDTDLLVAGSSTLLVGVTETITYTVRFDPNLEAGPFVNTADGTADDPLGGMVSDSDTASVLPGENPSMTVTKTFLGPVTDNGGGSFTAAFQIDVE
ncbi:MAG: DUF11 domain-containing protein, partial [Holophagales bacterium]|nr:DUF11 domain-containing protein [Holophagales bacterium]